MQNRNAKNPYGNLVRDFWKLKVLLRLQKDFDPILTRSELTTAWAPLSRLEKFKVIEVLQKNKVPLTSSPELLIISWWVVEKIAQAAAQDWIYKDCIWRRKRRCSRWLSIFWFLASHPNQSTTLTTDPKVCPNFFHTYCQNHQQSWAADKSWVHFWKLKYF